jgi:glycosyltransferase involved in cell wall biosynthesis
VRVLFFTDGPESPGSRFRCLQFFPHLERRGIRCAARFAYDARYNDVFERPWANAYKLAGRLRRVGHLLFDGSADVLFLHKTALALTGLPERLRALRRTPLVFDFDDAIYLGPGGVEDRQRRRTFESVVAVADHLVAGNHHLARVAGRPDVTTVIPSVVDTDIYVPAPARRVTDELVVGWMGTASNFPSLRLALPSLVRAVETLPRARVRIVSNAELPEWAGHPRVEQWRWNEAGELRALQSFDVGLMPLDDTELTRGKCGFKMIQYMAVGVPVLSSAVGANIDIFEGSGAGALVRPGDDWGEKLLGLLASRERFRELGLAGRAHAVRHYSVASVIDRYVRIFEQLGRGAARRPIQAPFFSPSP